VDHPICLNPSILDWQISGTGLAQVLDIGDALNDCSQIGKTRDSYAILLFTFQTAYRLIVERRPMESLFILLLTLPLAALREEGIARDQRIFYADLAFILMTKIYSLSDLPRAEGVILVWQEGRSHACLLATESMWQRLLNTLFGLCRFLRIADSLTSGNRFGTHSVERYIALIRRLCHHYDDIK
jgi:hypothetical protein